jgi:hypothetical protein
MGLEDLITGFSEGLLGSGLSTPHSHSVPTSLVASSFCQVPSNPHSVLYTCAFPSAQRLQCCALGLLVAGSYHLLTLLCFPRRSCGWYQCSARPQGSFILWCSWRRLAYCLQLLAAALNYLKVCTGLHCGGRGSELTCGNQLMESNLLCCQH